MATVYLEAMETPVQEGHTCNLLPRSHHRSKLLASPKATVSVDRYCRSESVRSMSGDCGPRRVDSHHHDSAIARELFRTDWECQFSTSVVLSPDTGTASPIFASWGSCENGASGDCDREGKREARVEEYDLRTALTRPCHHAGGRAHSGPTKNGRRLIPQGTRLKALRHIGPFSS